MIPTTSDGSCSCCCCCLGYTPAVGRSTLGPATIKALHAELTRPIATRPSHKVLQSSTRPSHTALQSLHGPAELTRPSHTARPVATGGGGRGGAEPPPLEKFEHPLGCPPWHFIGVGIEVYSPPPGILSAPPGILSAPPTNDTWLRRCTRPIHTALQSSTRPSHTAQPQGPAELTRPHGPATRPSHTAQPQGPAELYTA